jgi:hypothetical protein
MMIRTFSVSPVLLAALAAALVLLGGCGSSGDKSTTTAPSPSATKTTTARSQPLSAAPGGRYTAQLTSPGLEAQGVDTIGVGGGGLWHLVVGPHKLTFTAPAGHPTTTYRVIRLDKREITLAPNPECSTASGKTHDSMFTLGQVNGDLAFAPVKKACVEDVGVLAVAPWHLQ